MSVYKPGIEVTIGGCRCVVICDAVAHTLPPSDDVVVLDRLDGRMVYCALSSLKYARERYPGLPAYGFWQVLLSSGLVDKAGRLQAVYFDERNGQYLYQDAAVAFTGEIRNGALLANGGYALDPSAARVIACEIRDLRLPRKAALSFEERERERVARKFRFASRLAAVAVFLSVALLAYDGKRRSYEADLQVARDALEVRAEALAVRKVALRETRIEKWPDQHATLDDLLHFAIALERFTLPETPLEHTVFEVRVPDPNIYLPPMVSTIVSGVEHRRDGLLSLRWSRSR